MFRLGGVLPVGQANELIWVTMVRSNLFLCGFTRSACLSNDRLVKGRSGSDVAGKRPCFLLSGSAGRREEESPEEAYYYNTKVAPIIEEMGSYGKGSGILVLSWKNGFP